MGGFQFKPFVLALITASGCGRADMTTAAKSLQLPPPLLQGELVQTLQQRRSLREFAPKETFTDPSGLAAAIKSCRLPLVAARPLAEAISTAGGVDFAALDQNLMIRLLPGVFCAGEMLDWEAPTGGYLLTACFSTGRAAGQGVFDWRSV